MILKARVWPSLYQDSVILMRVASEVRQIAGIDEAASFMGTSANHAILQQAGMSDEITDTAGPNDMLFCVRAVDEQTAELALERAQELLNEKRQTEDENEIVVQPRTLDSALRTTPDANLAILSIPGPYVLFEAQKALKNDLNVMIFTDNVRVEDEIELKTLANQRSLLCMGPDCGTAYVNGAGLAFANLLDRGRVGCVAASGTGLQAVVCRLAMIGEGVSQGIGVGGRDLSEDVGGLMTFSALKMLAEDPATEAIIVITKPPAPEMIARLNRTLAKIDKPTVVCSSGIDETSPEGVRWVGIMDDAADAVRALLNGEIWSPVAFEDRAVIRAHLENIGNCEAFAGAVIHGYYTGGTLAYEARGVLTSTLGEPRSNLGSLDVDNANLVLDLGEDAYTVGRPHPMIEPMVRSDAIDIECQREAPQIMIADLVLGTGSHDDPASQLVETIDKLRALSKAAGKPFVALVVVIGTIGDPQGLSEQIEKLREAGALVFRKNSEAVRFAALLSQPNLEVNLL